MHCIGRWQLVLVISSIPAYTGLKNFSITCLHSFIPNQLYFCLCFGSFCTQKSLHRAIITSTLFCDKPNFLLLTVLVPDRGQHIMVQIFLLLGYAMVFITPHLLIPTRVQHLEPRHKYFCLLMKLAISVQVNLAEDSKFKPIRKPCMYADISSGWKDSFDGASALNKNLVFLQQWLLHCIATLISLVGCVAMLKTQYI